MKKYTKKKLKSDEVWFVIGAITASFLIAVSVTIATGSFGAMLCAGLGTFTIIVVISAGIETYSNREIYKITKEIHDAEDLQLAVLTDILISLDSLEQELQSINHEEP